MASGISLIVTAAADIPTPASGKVTVFVDSTTGEPSYKDDAGTAASLKGAQGDAGPTGAAGADGADGVGVPAGGTSGQVLAKVDGTDYNTEWVDQSAGGGDVDSVNGQTGVVVLDAADVGAAEESGTPSASFTIEGTNPRLQLGTSGDEYIGYNAMESAWVITFGGVDWNFGGKAIGQHAGSWVGDAIPVTKGGTGLTSLGSANQYLRVNSAGDAFEFTSSSTAPAWGDLTGTLANQTDLQAALNDKLDVDLTTPRAGQVLWYNGTDWTNGPKVSTTDTEPSSPEEGDIWFDLSGA